ncbi:MAG: DUF4019 domain-containing protein [Terrimicrobiaceae bacterium]|nr:DUF4019 domain-containing protein [Terrimicrobiaceae bacterium]
MSESLPCPKCGAPLPAIGICATCAADFLGGEPTGAADEPFVPPTVAEMAEKFPQLEILEFIGRGGMGAVYKARQRELDRVVALKILPPGIGGDPAFAERFAREARALARLSHPNIVTLFEFGRAEGGPYFFLMEFVDGVNLRQLLLAERMSPREALGIVPQICDALQFAHDHGIVHRDIKPENILLDRRGRVKVADFGLAKLIGPEVEPAGGGSAATGELTGTGKILGTPSYMAPEQTERPDAVDHRADIYALGVVFYQMLTGELPGKEIEPPSRRMRIDVRLDEVVLRALEKDPDRRYAQASVMKTQVETISTDGGTTPTEGREIVRGLDYRSKAALFGLPLLHVTSGFDPVTGKARVARGIIAIGGVAKGVIAIGGAALGGLAIGGLAGGIFAYGGLALGLVSFGGLALALCLAIGGGALAPVAMGGGAVGYYSYGGGVWGVHPCGANFYDAAGRAFFEPWAVPLMARLGLFNAAAFPLILLAAVVLPWWLVVRARYPEQKKRANRLLALGVAAVLAVASAVGIAVAPQRSGAIHSSASKPESAISDWLALMDDGKYARAWQEAAESFHQAITQDDWAVKSRQIRQPLGKVISRKTTSSQRMTALPGLPDGTYFVAKFQTDFAGLPEAEETIAFARNPEGQWQAISYLIRPHADEKPAAPSPPATGAERAAVAAAETWLASIDAGKFVESWTDAAALFRKAVTQPQWTAALESVRTPLGRLRSRALHSARTHTNLPGAPDGDYVVMQFDTTFANKSSAVETVTFILEPDGQWRAAGYFIK